MKERKKGAELREQLGLDPVSLVITKGRPRWFGHVERKDDADWIKCCTTIELDERTTKKNIHGGTVTEDRKRYGLAQEDAPKQRRRKVVTNRSRDSRRRTCGAEI